jgi:hypothetical protein
MTDVHGARAHAPRRPNLVPTLRHIAATMRHKWFVALAGLKTGAHPFDLLVHDLSKLGPSEAPHYGRRLFGANDDPVGFALAWNHHQNMNRHHWEHWIPRGKHMRDSLPGDGREPLPMTERAVREMAADWIGARRAYEGVWPTSMREWPWLVKNFHKVRLHPESRRILDGVMREVFGEGLEALEPPKVPCQDS